MTNIKTKTFNSEQRNLSSSTDSNVRHQHPDSPFKVTEDSIGAKTNETIKIYRDDLNEHIPAPLVI